MVKSRKSKISFVLILLILSIITGCNLKQESRSGRQIIELASGTPLDTTISVLSGVQSSTNITINSNTIVLNTSSLDPADPLYNITSGKVLVFGASETNPKGSLVMVETVKTEGDIKTLTTRNATIEEAFSDLEIDIHSKFLPDDPDLRFIPMSRGVSFNYEESITRSRALSDYLSVEDGVIIIELVDIVLYDEDNNKNTTYDQLKLNGKIELSLEFDFEASLVNKTMSFSLSPVVTDTLGITANFSSEHISKEIEIGRISKTFTFMAGGVPVVVTPEFSLSIGVEGSASVGFETEISAKASFSTGLKYDKGWEQTQNTDIEFTYTLPSISGKLDIKAYLKPEFKVWLYKSVAPKVSWEPYLLLNAETVVGYEHLADKTFFSPEWSLKAGHGIHAGCYASIFGFLEKDFTFIFPVEEKILFSSLSTPGGVTASQGTSNSAVNIIWNSVKNAENYKIFRSDNSDSGFVSIGISTATSYSDSNIVSGNIYYYRIMAYSSSLGTSPSANTVSGFSGDTEEPVVDPVNHEYTDMVAVTGGTFAQSNSFNHTISDFSIGKYEVTYNLWHTVYSWATDNGFSFANQGREGHDGKVGEDPTSVTNEPVTTINWRDTIVWCNAYSQKSGYSPIYENGSGIVINDSSYSNSTECDTTVPVWSNNGYRLLTEGEWLFAASGGNNGNGYIYSGSNIASDVAWYDVNSYGLGNSHIDYGTHNVGEKQSNELGLYDMSGNVWEWCYDWYGGYPSDTTDYRGGAGDYLPLGYRVICGGSWGIDNHDYTGGTGGGPYLGLTCDIAIFSSGGGNSFFGGQGCKINNSGFRLSRTTD